MKKDYSPEIDTNMDLFIDWQSLGKPEGEIVSVATSTDNLIVLAVSRQGLFAFSTADEWLTNRLNRIIENGYTVPVMTYMTDYRMFESYTDPVTYFFRFSKSVFAGLPQEAITFNFDVMHRSGRMHSVSISAENHPIVAAIQALSDLEIPQGDVQAMALSIEYCGLVVFESPSDLLKTAFRGATNG